MTKGDIEFIQNNGGEVSHLVECFTVQIYKQTNAEGCLVSNLNSEQKNYGQFANGNEIDQSKIPLDLYYPG